MKTSPPKNLTIEKILTYRANGHIRLDAKAYYKKCNSCIWGCKMPVEMIINQWNPSQKLYRVETFKSFLLYKSGPTRKVPGRKGMVWEEANWVDERDTDHCLMEE